MTYADRIAAEGGRGALAVVLLLSGAPVLAADGFSTDWAKAAKSEARLVAAGGALAGFEIRLAPGAITYWRDPGEAGVPPTFDFSGSDNVAKVEPVFPAPKRIHEADGSEAFGYEAGVIIPLIVERRDPAKPVTLALDASYAVCEKLCLPAEAKLDADPARRRFAFYPGSRGGARRGAASRRARRVRHAHRRRRRGLAPVRGPRGGAAARPVRRAAGRLVGGRGAGAVRRGP